MPGHEDVQLDVNVIGDFDSSTGLAEAARRQVEALVHARVGVQVVPVDLDAPKSKNRRSPLVHALPRGRGADIDIHYENTNVFSALPDNVVHPPGRPRSYTIASWYWELPELPWDFIPSVLKVDEIWVAAEYVQHIFLRVVNKPVTVIPAVITGDPSSDYDRKHFGLPERPVIYFFNFDASSSYARKNPAGLIKAFETAFAEHERGTTAVLVVKAMRLHWFPDLERFLRREMSRINGILMVDDLSHTEMASLINCIDVYVSLHRCEGFGMGMAEAMRMGKPLIATAFSANVDFCTAENSLQVGYDLVQVADDDHKYHPVMTGLYRAGQYWADPDLDQAARWMRHLFDHPGQRARLGAAARKTIVEQFNYQVAGEKMRQRLHEIYQLRGKLPATA